jgi:hypothetical protein
MIGKKDIEILRLKTRIEECKSILETATPYASQKESAKQHLDLLQEEYKALTGEFFGIVLEGSTPGEKMNDELRVELTEAFLNVISKGMKIPLAQIKDVDSFQKSTMITLKNGSKHVITYMLDEVNVTPKKD